MTRNDTDFGASSAIAAILILAAAAAISAVFLAAVYPVQLHEAEAENIEERIASLTDIRLMMDAARLYPEIEIAAPLPNGALTTEKGMLYLNDEPIQLTNLRLLAGDTAAGIAANGIWRQDGGATWSLFPQYQREKAALTLEVMNFENDLAYGSTEMIPFRFSYQESVTHTAAADSLVLRFESEDMMMERLWEIYFQEISFTLQQITNSYYNNFNAGKNGNTLYLSGKRGTITVQIIEHRYAVYAGDFV